MRARALWLESPARPPGYALVITLVLLVAATLLALGALQTSALATRMAGAAHDRALALQAAEAALRDARDDLDSRRADGSHCAAGSPGCRLAGERPFEERQGGPGATLATADCTAGQCRYAATQADAPWRRFMSAGCDPAATVEYGRYTGAPPLPGLSTQACYLLEFAKVPGATPDGRYLIRITARGAGARSDSVVVLQQTLSRENS